MKILITENQFSKIILNEGYGDIGKKMVLIGYHRGDPKGKAGTWYYLPESSVFVPGNYAITQDKNNYIKKVLHFNNILDIPQSEIDVNGDTDYVMQYIFDKWFPFNSVDDKYGYKHSFEYDGDDYMDKEEEHIMSNAMAVRKKALDLGYDGIKFGDEEVVAYND